MARINENFLKLPGSYLFTETARRAAEFAAAHPERRLIRLGVGDVTLPLPGAAAEAMARASAEMGTAAGFHGYGPEQGYLFLRQTIAQWDYRARGVDVSPEEIFVSDGAKSDCGGILDLFGGDNVVALCDPVYPAYADAAAIAGRAGEYDRESGRWTGLRYLPCTEENGFVPTPPEGRADLVYLCFPNNPTGAMATREQLGRWVDWANGRGAVLLFDGAYEAFITGPELPHSIFEIPGAETCAIEFRSFSKTAGFTGTRCAYTVIPSALRRGGASLRDLWARRQAARFNGVPYVVQRGAEALYSSEGRRQTARALDHYRANARILLDGLAGAGLTAFGGIDAPYVWVRTPEGLSSWDFFDLLLEKCALVTTPGAGFGPCGEGYLRLTAFGGREDTEEAVARIRTMPA
ncbi:MAG: LL-diaminopimelate aminotransferase [Candidatus Enterenecus sp.]